MSYDQASLIVAVASFLAALAAAFIAKASLTQAERVAERDLRDWRQRTWCDVYYKADELYDALNAFQADYGGTPVATVLEEVGFQEKANELRMMIRRVHSMAALFPQNPVMNALFASTTVFAENHELLSPARLETLFNAVEGIREKALIHEPGILG